MTQSKVLLILAFLSMQVGCGSSGGVGTEASSLPNTSALTSFKECELGVTSLSPSIQKQMEDVCHLTNIKRLEAGLPALTLELSRTQVANDHANDMATRNFFDHSNPDGESPFDRLSGAGIAYTAAAENIAKGHTNAQQVVDAWMASAGHRANILNQRLRRFGVGTTGTLWVQIFTD